MARIQYPRITFLGGEVSPRARRRTDLPQYSHSFEELLNWIVHPQGGATRRPGFRYRKKSHNASNVADGSLAPRICPFIFKQDEAYVMELTPGYTSGARFIDVNNPSSVTQMNGFSNLHSFSADDLQYLQFSQSADIIWFTHPDYSPFILARTDFTGSIEFQCNLLDGHAISVNGAVVDDDLIVSYLPFRDVNVTGTGFTPYDGTTYAGGENIKVSASTSGASPVEYFVPEMIGSIYKITRVTGGLKYTGSFRITAMEGSAGVSGKYSACQATVIDDINGSARCEDWEECAWSDYRGWPRTVAHFEGRIYFGGNAAEPDRIWASAVDNFFHLDARGAALGTADFPTQTASSAFNFVPNAGQVNDIQWISPGKTLPVGTLGREFIISGPDQTQGVSSTNIAMTPETAHGSAFVQPARIANVVSFIQRSRKKLRELVFDFNSDSYVATDIGLLANHLLASNVKGISWQEYPNGVLWCHNDNGSLAGLTRERQQQIAAWHSHSLGGFSDSDQELAPDVISTCVVPNDDGVDRLWAVVKRYINGASVYYIEEMQDEFVDGNDITVETANCLDSHIYSTNASATVTWAAAHLKGQTVKVVASENEDGSEPYYAGEFTVNASTGNVTLNRAAKSVMIGLKFTSRAKTLKMEGGSSIGASHGQMKRADKLSLGLYNAYGLKFGSSEDNLKEINFNNSSNPLGISLFTGDKYLDYPNGWDRDQQVVLESEWPFPCSVNHISVRAQVNEV